MHKMVHVVLKIFLSPSDILPNDEEKKLQEWLSAPNSSINYTTALNKRTPGTGVWIFDHPIYNAWREEHGILWIQGKGG